MKELADIFGCRLTASALSHISLFAKAISCVGFGSHPALQLASNGGRERKLSKIRTMIFLFNESDTCAKLIAKVLYPRDSINRLIAGDSILTMNSGLEKEDGWTGKVQMIYLEPAYGFSSQPFVKQA